MWRITKWNRIDRKGFEVHFLSIIYKYFILKFFYQNWRGRRTLFFSLLNSVPINSYWRSIYCVPLRLKLLFKFNWYFLFHPKLKRNVLKFTFSYILILRPQAFYKFFSSIVSVTLFSFQFHPNLRKFGNVLNTCMFVQKDVRPSFLLFSFLLFNDILATNWYWNKSKNKKHNQAV